MLSSDKEDISGRYVVLRAINDSFEFTIYTDLRTAKVKQFTVNKSSALLFYDSKKKLQIRINGFVSLHHKDQLTRPIWNKMPDFARREYQSELSPGTQISNSIEGHEVNEEFKDDYFCVIRFVPSKMDVLQLSKMGHLRFQFQKEKDNWVGTRISP